MLLDMHKQWICIIGLFLLFQIGYAYRECYQCNSRTPYDTASACSSRDPVTRLLNRFKYMDDDEECYRCVKQITPSGHVYRGCISRQGYKDIKEYFSDGDSCSSDVPMPGTRLNFREYCKCSSNKCNGSDTITTSTTSLLICAAIFLVLQFRSAILP